jgi:hypothetical protein
VDKKSRQIIALIEVIVFLILISGMVLNQTIRQKVEDIIFNGLYSFNNSQEPTPKAATSSVITKATTTITTATTTAGLPGATNTPKSGSKSITCSPVPSGAQTYNVSTKDNPKITQVIINPLDVKKLARQTVNVNIQELNNKQITVVSGVAVTDNKSVTFSLSLISGTNTNGTWQGSWLNQDSYCHNYKLSITAKSESDQSSVVLTFK